MGYERGGLQEGVGCVLRKDFPSWDIDQLQTFSVERAFPFDAFLDQRRLSSVGKLRVSWRPC